MSGKKPIRMLSIDDKTLTTDLDRAGYRNMGVYVKAAANYEEAMKLLGEGKIDLVVINMDYPHVDAPSVAKHLKSEKQFQDLPVVLTSVQTSAKVRNSAIQAGADLFVEQPLPRQYFIEKLKQLLEQTTRSTERVDIRGEVKFKTGTVEETCGIGDLSASGILLSTTTNLDSGTKVEVEFDLPGYKKTIAAIGEVVRIIKADMDHPQRPSGIGVRFTDFHGDSQKRLERYIEKTAHEDSMRYYL